jgi:hypothetical protein
MTPLLTAVEYNMVPFFHYSFIQLLQFLYGNDV